MPPRKRPTRAAKGATAPKKKPRKKRLADVRAAIDALPDVPAPAPVPEELRAAMIPQPHGGALLPGGVPGNRGLTLAQKRRELREGFLDILLRQGKGVLEEQLSGIVERDMVEDVRDANGDITEQRVVRRKVTISEGQRKDVAALLLLYGAGPVSQHTVVDENDEPVTPAMVVELPMLDAPPVPPDTLAVSGQSSMTQVEKDKMLAAAQTLLAAMQR